MHEKQFLTINKIVLHALHYLFLHLEHKKCASWCKSWFNHEVHDNIITYGEVLISLVAERSCSLSLSEPLISLHSHSTISLLLLLITFNHVVVVLWHNIVETHPPSFIILSVPKVHSCSNTNVMSLSNSGSVLPY